jgi:hypothetical protein
MDQSAIPQSVRDVHSAGPTGPQRISALAVVSMVCGILCCLPFVGTVGVILGGLAILLIAKSGGRLGGRTLAVVGIVLGIIGTAGWGSAILGARQWFNNYREHFAKPGVALFTEIQDGKTERVREILAASSGGTLTDERVREFGAEILRELGRPVGAIEHMSEWSAAPRAGATEATSEFSSGGLLKFDKGIVLVVLPITEKNIPSDFFPKGKVKDIVVIAPGGRRFSLLDEKAGAP